MPTTLSTASLERLRSLGIECSYRQLDYWVRCGYLGERHRNLGSGGQRVFDDADLEVLAALAQVTFLGGPTNTDSNLRQAISDAVRERRVDAAGELLVVDGTGHVFRCDPDVLFRVSRVERAAVVVPLRSFASHDLAGEVPPVPAGDGRHGSAAVTAALST